MELTARSNIVAASIALAAGLIAAAPAPTPPPDAQIRDVELTAGMEDVLDAQLKANSALINGFLDSNQGLVGTQQDLTSTLTGLLGGTVDPDGTPHGLAKDAVQQFFDANNALTGAGQASLLGLLGVRGTVDGGTFTPLDLAGLNESLLVDPHHAGSIPFAGLESAIGHYIGAVVFLNGFLNKIPEDEIEGNDTADSFSKLVADVTAFNAAVLAAEKDFGTDLVAREVDLEQALFGTDTAYSGVVNRAFNAFNMLFDGQQQSFNGVLGLTGYDPQEYTDALLTSSGGAGGQVFNDGSVGGLLGMANQLLMALLDGFDSSAGSNIPDGFTADPAAVGGAFDALMQTLAGGVFGDTFAPDGAFSVLLTDLQDLFGAGL